MSRNGSGTYSLPAGNPVSGGTVISSTWANSTLSDIATALTQSIAKDGQTVPTANLPMGTYKHTNVAVGAALTDYARYDQLQNSAPQWLTSVSGADTITASAPVAPAAYAAGQTFRFVSAGANTGAVTLNVNSLGAKDVTKNGTTALTAGDIASGAVITVTYDGTRFQIASSASISFAGDNTWTGANTFRNASGIRSEQAATQDAIAIVGRAGGTGSYEAAITPTTLTADRTITVPDASGTIALQANSGVATRTAGNVTTSSTSLVDLTDMSVTVTLQRSGRLAFSFVATEGNNTANDANIFNVMVDSTLVFGSQGIFANEVVNINDQNHICISGCSDVLAAGSHTVKIQWRTASGGTGTVYASATTTPRLSVWEIA